MDLGGDQVTELNGAGQWQHSNVFSAARLTATYDYNGGHGGLHYELADPLGTKRVQANISGVVEMSWASLPYGDALTPIPPTNPPPTSDDATEHHFTAKERDTESGNDYFEARYYSSAMGRFMSPDWSAKAEPVPYAKLDNPQSLNLYAYMMNNPLAGVDADGHGPQDPPCNEVHIEEAEKTKPKVQENIKNADGSVGTGVIVPVEITVTHHGDAIPGVQVTEKNKNDLSVNGTDHKIKTLEGLTKTTKEPLKNAEFK
ncbi:MAG: RHS repeat-associated core domain-containing protein, partial [Terracidiphilus sp.]